MAWYLHLGVLAQVHRLFHLMTQWLPRVLATLGVLFSHHLFGIVRHERGQFLKIKKENTKFNFLRKKLRIENLEFAGNVTTSTKKNIYLIKKGWACGKQTSKRKLESLYRN